MKKTFLNLFLLIGICVIAFAGSTVFADKPPPQHKRPVGEMVFMESVGEKSIVVVACPFSYNLNKLSPEKFEMIVQYAAVKVLKGKLEFGAKFKVVKLIEGAFDQEFQKVMPILGDFRILLLYDQPDLKQPFDQAHSLPYSPKLESDIIDLINNIGTNGIGGGVKSRDSK